MWWEKLLNYLIVFGSGGFFCLLAQILIIKTKLTPARILVIFLLGGIALEAIGVYDFLYQYLKAGISVPIIGFGASLAKGSISYARTYGFPRRPRQDGIRRGCGGGGELPCDAVFFA